MKAISASIVVVAGAILLLGGPYIQHSDTKLFVQAVGCVVGLIGLGGWFVALTPDNHETRIQKQSATYQRH